MPINKDILSCSETGDIVTAAQLLIVAGARNNDPESIQAGVMLWKTAWPANVVDQVTPLIIQDAIEEMTDN